MRAAARSLVAAGAVAVFAASVATAAESERIQTDRPSFSNSASTVQPGALQLETGVDYSRTSTGGSPAQKQFTLEVTLRAGLTERLELRLESDALVVTRGPEDDTGTGDLFLEAKYRFFDAREGSWWPSLGVLPFVKFPIAHAPHGTNVPDFGLIGLASFTLPWRLSLDANFGVGGTAQRPSGYVAQGLVSAALGRDLGERWSAYIEIFYLSAAERGGRGAVNLDAGVQFFPLPQLALDAAAQTSLAGSGPDYLFRCGLSVRFGR
jgi:hypothetical protein